MCTQVCSAPGGPRLAGACVAWLANDPKQASGAGLLQGRIIVFVHVCARLCSWGSWAAHVRGLAPTRCMPRDPKVQDGAADGPLLRLTSCSLP